VLISNHTLNFNGQDQMSWPEEWLNQRPIHFDKNKKLFIARENCVFYSITFGTERGWNCECTVLTALQQSKIHVQIFSTLMSGSDLIDHQIIWFTASAHGFSSQQDRMIMPLKHYAPRIPCALDGIINRLFWEIDLLLTFQRQVMEISLLGWSCRGLIQ